MALLNLGSCGFEDSVFGRYAGLFELEAWHRKAEATLAVVGRALSNSDDCSYHSVLVLK